MSVYSALVSAVLGMSTGAWSGVASRLSDGSDATGVVKTSYQAGDYITYRCSPPSIPAGEVVTRVRGKVRSSRPTSKSGVSVACGLYRAGEMVRVSALPGAGDGSASAGWIYQAWQDRTPYGGKLVGGSKTLGILPGDTPPAIGAGWTNTDAASLIIRITDRAVSLAAISTLLEAGCDVETASLPLAPTVSLPTGSITDTTQPTIVWAHSDKTVRTVTTKAIASNVATITTGSNHGFTAGQTVGVAIGDAAFDGAFAIIATPTATTFTYAVNNPNVASTAATGSAWIGDDGAQSNALVRVFTAAQYGAAGFDPATSVATWSTYVQSSAQSAVVEVPLVNGTTYRAYVQTAKRSPASPQGDLWGGWSYTQFSLALSLPPAPTGVAVWDPARQAMRIVVQAYANLFSAQAASAEDGTTTGWGAAINCTIASSAAWAATGTRSIQVTATAASDVRAETTGAGVGSVPVTPGQAYTATVTSRAATAGRNARATILWRTSAGAYLSETNGAYTANATGADTAHTVTGTAPPGAAYAGVGFDVQAPAAGEVHRVDKAGLMPGAGTAWSAGALTASTVQLVRLLPGAGNLLTADEATMTAGIGAWSPHTNTTVSRGLDPLGAYAVVFRSSAAGDARIKADFETVVPGSIYSATVDVVRISAVARSVRLDVSWWTLAGGYISGMSSTATAAGTGAYSTLTVTGTVPASAVYAIVEVVALSTAAAGEAWAVRRAALMPGPDPAFRVGGTWKAHPAGATVRGADAVTLDPATLRAEVWDYEAPRSSSAIVGYGATVTHTIAAARASLTGYVPAIATPGDGRWWVKAVDEPALNRAAIVQRGTSLDIDETVGVFRPLGRPGESVVVSGDVAGRDGTYTLRAVDAADSEALEALAVWQGTLLLQEPWQDSRGVGAQRWVRAVKRRRGARVGGTVPWVIDVVEVGSGI